MVHFGGEQFVGTWSRSAQADPYVYTIAGGEPFGLPTGNTYIALLPR